MESLEEIEPIGRAKMVVKLQQFQVSNEQPHFGVVLTVTRAERTVTAQTTSCNFASRRWQHCSLQKDRKLREDRAEGIDQWKWKYQGAKAPGNAVWILIKAETALSVTATWLGARASLQWSTFQEGSSRLNTEITECGTTVTSHLTG